MPFVKLDCGILNSTLWFERECRDVFLTALLMAEPFELKHPTPQIAVDSLKDTGWIVPIGWYGFVPAASVGILHRAGVSDGVGFEALRRLGEPEISSRSPEFEGRRLVRIDGGFLVLNYIKYRERDYTAAERSRRYRQRLSASRRSVNMSRRDGATTSRVRHASPRNITQAEEEAEVEEEKKKRGSRPMAAPAPPPDARSKRPIFSGQRLTVFEWMLDDCIRTLGPHLETFDLHEWFFALDAHCLTAGVVVPKRDGGAWLQHELVAEAQKRGLPLVLGSVPKADEAEAQYQAAMKRGPSKRGV